MASRLRTRLRASTGLATPSLNIELATAAGGLDPRITFSRGTQATLTDSTGKITYAPNNLLTNSQDFEASSWSKAAGTETVTANTAAAPDGTLTADTITTVGSNGLYRVVSGVNSSTIYTVSVYVKWVSGGTTFRCGVQANPTTGSSVFNIVNGTVVSNDASVISSSITSAGSGWFRCSVTFAATSTTTTPVFYSSSGAASWYMWGAQLEAVTYQTTPGTYNSTTPKNLLGYTQEFDNAVWGKGNGTITSNAVAAPDGTLSADSFVSTAATAATFVQQAFTSVAAPYAASIYVKANGVQFVQLLWSSAQSTNYANFDLAAGTVGTNTAASATITSVGNGWYRIGIVSTLTAAAGAINAYCVPAANSARGASFVGDGTSGIYVWGAQLSNSASLDTYVYNPGAAPTSAAYYGPRFDYDPVTLAPKGLLIEEQRSNLLLRSEQFDNASWNKVNATVTADATTSPDGAAGADALVEDATTGAHYVQQFYTGFTSGTAYTMSAFIKAGTRTWVEMDLPSAAFGVAQGGYFNLSGSGSLGNATGSPTSRTITALGNGWYRITVTATATATAGGNCLLIAASANGTTSYAGTNGAQALFLWGAQLEAGAFATSYIPTVASTVTRSADVAQMLGDNFASWYNQNAGTFTFSGDSAYGNGGFIGSIPTTGAILYGNNGTSRTFNGTNFIGTANSFAANARFSTAMAYATADRAIVLNSGTIATDTNSIQQPTAITLGSAFGGGYLNGHIQSIRYYPTRLTNTQLQVLTT